MHKKRLLIICLTLLSMAMLEFAFANNRYLVADFNDDNAVKIFAENFKKAVINRDKEMVASMIKYPTMATFSDKKIIINNAKEFVWLYDDIFVRDLINKITSYSTDDMFANYQGVMLGNGEVWFGKDGDKTKVISVGVCREYYPVEDK